MPWKETKVLDQKRLFISRWCLGEECLTSLCEEFGVSRKTGYKWIDRFKKDGIGGLENLSQRPHAFRDETPREVVCEIIRIKNWKPFWGGRKIGHYLRAQKQLSKIPHSRTIDRYLRRCGYVTPRKTSSPKEFVSENLIEPSKPNDVWTLDFKGWWRTKDGKRCEPLTIRNMHSRYLLNLSAHRSATFEAVKERFYNIFEEFGLPRVIRSDNGGPFASVRAMHRLTRFGIMLMKHGVVPNRMDPGSPQQNGAHERMHLDIKRELQSTPAGKLRSEQERFDIWRYEFNHVRPHESLGGSTPAKCYKPSAKRFMGDKATFEYPVDFSLRKVSSSGDFFWNGKAVRLSKAFAGEYVGIEDCGEVDLNVYFCDFHLASLHRKERILTPTSVLRREAIGKRN